MACDGRLENLKASINLRGLLILIPVRSLGLRHSGKLYEASNIGWVTYAPVCLSPFSEQPLRSRNPHLYSEL
jgi:hypothetical protein